MFKRIQQKEKKKTLGVKEPSMETLIETLSSHKDRAREGARHTLVTMGKAAVPSLIEALKNGAPRAKPMVPKRRPQGANIPYQRTNSPMGRTRGPLGSG